MKNMCLLSPMKMLLLICSMLLVSLNLSGLHASEDSDEARVFVSRKKAGITYENVQRAKELIQTLYTISYEEFDNLFGRNKTYAEVGTQAGYYGREGTDQAYSPLVIYKRVWVYDAGIALSLAIQDNDPTVDARALWLLKKGQYTRDPKNPTEAIFAGWPFSQNQKDSGDNWTDCRFINGANAYAVQAIADYITSDYYLNLSDQLKAAYSKLYSDALSGLLYHIESNGPNQGLIAAGWSLNILEDFAETKYSYNKILDMLGYGPQKIDGYSKSIRRVRARNIVTEHNINLLSVLNYALKHYDRLFRRNSYYTYGKLNEIRMDLRESIYSKLYDKDKRRFITGRSPAGEPSAYTAIDNASWLTLALKLEELNDEKIKALSDSLLYTVNNFTKDFKIVEKTYFGAHYFEDGFEDPYIEKSDVHSDSLHIEATCGLICGLLKFANTFPEDPNTPVFRYTASELWENLQHFVDDYGFVYASNSLKDVVEPIEASVSAIWYLRTYNYMETLRDR